MQSIEMETKEGQALKLPQFRWGVRRGVGTKGKNVRFYESFSYNGTDYSRYDCVTVYKKGEQEPYIAKITKIWEDLDDTTKPRKIKLHWFFRPAELYNAAVDFKPIASPNEIFIASGTGKGVANINPIEDSFQGTTVQMLKSSNSTECSVHYELVNLVNSMNDKLQRLEKQFEHMKKRLDRIDKQVWKSRNAKFSTKVIDTAKVNQPKNGTKKRKFGKIREQIPKESFPTDEKNVELREDASLNKRSGSKWGCYICKGAHYARMCPLR